MAIPAGLQAFAFDIALLNEDPKNARLHNERNLNAVKHSLSAYGWRGLVVARRSDRRIVAGHARIAAAKALGWTQAPVLFVEDDDQRATAFAIADNRTGELASWDNGFLQEAMAELEADELNDLGFSLEEFEQVSVGSMRPQDVDEEAEALQAQTGEKLVRAKKAKTHNVVLLFVREEYEAWKQLVVNAEKHGMSDVPLALVEAMEVMNA